MRLARVVGAVGRTLVTAGTLILLFVVYQLWGTGLREAQSQERLEDEFAELLAEADDDRRDVPPTTTTTERDVDATTSPTTTTETQPSPLPVPEGTAIAHISIPKIGLEKTVVEGVSVGDLKKGPGHYPETPLPGQEGNAAIAGHRTTYGAPFNQIDELGQGDEIFVETVQGRFRYVFHEQLIVEPTAVEVLEDKGDDRLTLTACHPEYSARQRIIVVAMLDPEVEALPRPVRVIDDDILTATPTSPASLDDIDGEGAAVWPPIALGALSGGIWLVGWLLGRRWRRWPAYGLALPFFLVSLFFFFEEFSRLLPSNY